METERKEVERTVVIYNTVEVEMYSLSKYFPSPYLLDFIYWGTQFRNLFSSKLDEDISFMQINTNLRTGRPGGSNSVQ